MAKKENPPPQPESIRLLVSEEMKAALRREGHDSPNYVVPPPLPAADSADVWK